MTKATVTPIAQAAKARAKAKAPVQGTGIVGAVVRALRLRNTLWGHFAHGLTATDIAKAASESPSYVTRALQTLELAGDVERIVETDRWRLSVRLGREACAIHRSLDAAQARLAEIQTRVGSLV